MNTVLWIVQGILAAMFLMAGFMKATSPYEKLTKSMQWATRYPLSAVRIIGLSEALGAMGLVLPMLLGILPALTWVAAVALAIIMIFAMVHHSKHGEKKEMGFNSVLLLLLLVVIIGRFNLI